MEMAIYWLIAAIVLAVVEVATTSLVSIWFVFGALIAMIVAYFGAPFIFQLVAFVLISAVIMYFARPLAKKIAYKKTTPTNADRIVGVDGIVLEEINELNNAGQVKVLGQIWSAKSENGFNISKGKTVRIKAIEGVKVVVVEIAEKE